MTTAKPYEIQLPWMAPPMNLNHRMHWRRKAALTRAVRDTTHVLVKAAKIKPCPRVDVTLHYQPRDRRVRDEENPTPTYKAICDGIVDAGVVPDDSPEFMVKHLPVIHPADKGLKPRLWLVVQPLFESAT